MGNFNEQRQQREKREVREYNKLDMLAKQFYDLSKTSFTVMVAGTAVAYFTENCDKGEIWIATLIGVALTIVFACIAYTITNIKK